MIFILSQKAVLFIYLQTFFHRLPEEANSIGYETASRFLKGKHAFVVATHTDKAHIAIARMILTSIYAMVSTGEVFNPSDLLKHSLP